MDQTSPLNEQGPWYYQPKQCAFGKKIPQLPYDIGGAIGVAMDDVISDPKWGGDWLNPKNPQNHRVGDYSTQFNWGLFHKPWNKDSLLTKQGIPPIYHTLY